MTVPIKKKASDLEADWPELLVSYNNVCGLLSNKRLTPLPFQGCWGITWDETHLILGMNSSKLFFINPYERGFANYRGQYLHQIYYHPPHRSVYVCNTKEDRIDQYSLDREETSVAFQAELKAHLNGIWHDKKDSFWVCHSHNLHKHDLRGRSSSVEHDDRGFEIKNEYSNGTCSHSVLVEGDRIMTLSSLTGHIAWRNKTDNIRYGKSIDANDYGAEDNAIWLRGLARTEKNYIVGISQYEPDRAKRVVKHGYIFLLDNDLRYIEGLRVPMQVNDIRALEGDVAHNGLGFPFDIKKLI